MFDAGSAVFTLAGHVVRSGFEDYGRLVDRAEQRKEHRIKLGAETSTSGFEKFMLGVDATQKKIEEFTGRAKESFNGVSATTERMGAATGRGLAAVGDALNRTSEKFLALGTSSKESAAVVQESQAKVDRSVRASVTELAGATEKVSSEQEAQARAYKMAADQKIKANERVAESDRVALGAGGVVPPRGGGGGGGRGGGPEEEARKVNKSTSSMAKGFNTLANMGKWVTLGIVGIGAASVKASADFQRQMELIHTQANYSQKDVDSLRKSVLSLAPAVGVGPTELSKGLYHITSVLQGQGGTNEAMKILRMAAEGAKVGMANMEDVSSALMAIYKSAPRDIHSAAEAMGVMNDIVGQGNMRMEDLSKALSTGLLAAMNNAHLGLRDVGAALDTMTARGVPAEQASTRLRTTLTLMAAPTGKAAAALAQLGMSHDELANDMQKHGLSYALTDLQHHLDATFPPGRKLTLEQERQALTQYGQELEASGVHGKALATDLLKFKNQLTATGSSAVAQSQLITAAFGGSRMGTTMALLMQNADDVHKRFDNLNKADAAGRFQAAWKATQKDFSVQVSQMWAGIQRLAITLGDKLIPKIKDVVNWLIKAGHWMGHHKVLAEALAIAFGTLLTAAVAAFFVRFVMKTAEGVKAIGSFTKALVWDLPKKLISSSGDVIGVLDRWQKKLRGVQTAAEEAGGASAVEGEEAAAGGAGGVAGAAEGAIGGAVEGMVNGVKGVMAPGSIANPIAVVVMAADRYGLGAQGAASAAQTPTEAESASKQQEAQTTTTGSQPTKAASAETASAATSATAAEEAAMAKQAARQEFEQAFKQQYGAAPGPHITSAASTAVLPADASKEVQASFTKLQTATTAAASSIDDLSGTVDDGSASTSKGLRTLYEALVGADRNLETMGKQFGESSAQWAEADAKTFGAFNALDRALEKLPPPLQKLADEFLGVEEQFGTDAKETQTAFDRLIAAIDGTAGEIEGAGAAVAEDLKGGGAKAASTLEGGASAAAGEEEAGGASVAEDLKLAGAKAAASIEAGAVTAGEEEAVAGSRAVPSWVGVPPAGAAAEKAAAGAEGGVAGKAGVVAEEAAGGGGGGLMAGLKGMGGKLMGAAGMAGMGVMGAQLGGQAVESLTGSKAAGSAISTIGTTTSIGAGLGSLIAPGLGTAIGAGLGAAVGIGIKIFGSHSEDYGKQIANSLTKGFGGPGSKQLQEGIAKLINDGKKAADPAVRAAKFEQAGLQIAHQLEAGWNQYKFQDEPTMFKQFKSEVNKLPPYAKGAAGASAVQFAEGLEKQGRLPKGASQRMLDDIEKQYPDFVKYLGLAGHDSVRTFNAALNFKQAETNTKRSMKNIAADFPAVEDALKRTKGTTVTQAGAMVVALNGIIKNGSGPAKRGAEKDLQELRDQMNTYFTSMQTITESKIKDIAAKVKSGSDSARNSAATDFGQFAGAVSQAMKSGAESTKQGTQLITSALNTVLSSLGVGADTIKTAQILVSIDPSQASNLVKEAAAGVTGAGLVDRPRGGATGGMLPGAEFGSSDVMTLVDPMGRPRAKMAGDEGVFNRHQMPYVDLGLRMLGFNGSEGLWGSVTTPHGIGLASGGSLLKRQKGGFSGYSLPLPKSEMLPGSWSIDQGVDIPAPANTPEYAIGPGRIIKEGVSGFGPWAPVLYITAGPLAGRSVYYGHAGPARVKTQDTVKAGQQIAEVGAGIVGMSTGPHIEFGYYPPGGPGAGAAMATTLRQLMSGAGVTPPGGGAGMGGGPVWQDLPHLKVKGKGVMQTMVQKGLDKVTDAANTWGQNQVAKFAAASGLGAATLPNLAAGATEKQIYSYFKSQGWNKVAIAGLIGNWMAESSLNPSSVNSIGARGLAQWLGSRASSLEALAASEGKPWSDLAVQLQFAQREFQGSYHSAFAGAQSAPNAAAAADAIMNLYEQPGDSSGPTRQSYANQAFGQGYQKGGWLGGAIRSFRSGGRNPWAPLPSSVGNLPGFRPPRLRRGKGGLHVVGGGSSSGGASSAHRGSTRTKSGALKGTARTKQPISQTTAKVLDQMGLGTFVADQNRLGKLDAQYSTQESLFNMFDGGGGNGLPKQDLDVLMNIREQQWDILFNEWQQLPGAIASLQNRITELQGSPGHKGHWRNIPGAAYSTPHRGKGKISHGRKPTGVSHGSGVQVGHAGQKWVPGVPRTWGITGLEKDISSTETEISKLQQDIKNDTRKAQTAKHVASAQVMALADNYAQEQAGDLNDLSVIADQQMALSMQRISLQQQSNSITTTGSTGVADLNTIVSQVMSGVTSVTTSKANPQKKAIQSQILALRRQSVELSTASRQIHTRLGALRRVKDAAARTYRQQGFDTAWSYTVAKWGLEDKVTRLQEKLKKLKALLVAENKQLGQEQGALTQLQAWQTGGLQGDQAIIESLGQMGMNLLGLYQEGADLPTPGRQNPTLKRVEDVLSSAPPNGLGLTLPPGLTQGIQTATQAYTDFTNFQAARMALFSQFGSNFVGAGMSPVSSSAAIGAGPQFWGAAAGPSPGAGAGAMARGGWIGGGHSDPGKGGTTVNITNNFAAGPPDPHTWSAGTSHELNAMV